MAKIEILKKELFKELIIIPGTIVKAGCNKKDYYIVNRKEGNVYALTNLNDGSKAYYNKDHIEIFTEILTLTNERTISYCQ